MPRRGAGGSSEYRIFETDEFRRRLAALPAQDQNVIRAKLAEYAYPRLREQPFYGSNIRKLRGYAATHPTLGATESAATGSSMPWIGRSESFTY